MKNGKAVATQLRKTERGGIPWLVILDASGKELITSDGPDGNIGCPVKPNERAYFLKMLEETRQRMTDEDCDTVSRALADYAKKLGR